MANINRAIIINFLAEISNVLAPVGRVIFSGILVEEKEKVIEKLNDYSLKLVIEDSHSEWVGMVAEKMPKMS